MVERVFIQGLEAVGWGALSAGVDAFFGYPITPVNEITEWCSREFPKRGKVFFQTASETASINMLYGAISTGKRAFTMSAGPGWALMQETMSHMADAGMPAVVEVVSRGGPGQGTVRHGQSEYYSATRGGGQGNYRTIVLAPASAQEMHDFVQLAFHLAEKYRIPTIVLSDGIIAQTAEPVEFRQLELGPPANKDWALRGRGRHPDGIRRIVTEAQPAQVTYPIPQGQTMLAFWRSLDEKHRTIATNEVRYEEFQLADADLVLVAYGYVSRVCKEVVRLARQHGVRAGLLRPITLWPFPSEVLRAKARRGCRFLAVEDCFGQMVDDVRLAVEGRAPVHFLGLLAHHVPSDAGALLPGRVLEEVLAVRESN